MVQMPVDILMKALPNVKDLSTLEMPITKYPMEGYVKLEFK